MLAQIIDRVRDEHGADTPVILYGWSMGAGTSLVAAAILGERGDPVRAVVCEAPYRQPWTPALNVMRLAGLPWRINGPIAFALMGLRQGLGPTWRGFDRAKWAARVSAPVLVVHGTADAVCPVEDGRAIAEAAPNGSILEIDGAGHNDLWTDERYAPEVGAAVRRFVGTTLRESSPAPEPRTLTT